MKKLIFCLFAIITTIAAFSQTDSIPKNEQGNYEYSDVVQVDSASAQKLYSNAKIFSVTAFKSGKDVTQLNDENAKTVAGNGTMRVYFKGYLNSGIDYFVKFKLIIQCKDERYKYTFNNFEFAAATARVSFSIPVEDDQRLKHYATNKMKAQLLEQINNNVKQMIQTLKKTMASKTESTQDW